MQKYTKISIITALCICSLNAENSINNENLQDENLQILKTLNPQSKSDENVNEKQQKNSNVHDLGEIQVEAKGTNAAEAYYNTISQDEIQKSATGNGDIGTLLRSLPNVQFDNAARSSLTPGEINPADISISGGQFYQNKFILDGFNINNDLDPATKSAYYEGRPPGQSQGMNINVDLLESVTVMDSNIGAEYGGFNGGVVKAKTKRPTKDFGISISHQYTNGNINKDFPNSLTKYHIYGNEDEIDSFANSYSKNKQPEFSKHITKISAESQINDQWGIIGQFNRTYSNIPIRLYSDYHKTTYGGYNETEDSPLDPHKMDTIKQDQERYSYNAMIKAYYDPNPDLSFEFSYTYAPNYSREYLEGGKGFFYDVWHGGHLVGVQSTWKNSLGELTNNISFSKLSDKIIPHGYQSWAYWVSSENHHWGTRSGWAVTDGGYPGSISDQTSWSDKIVQEFAAFDTGNLTHKIKAGAEIELIRADFRYKDEHYLGNSWTKPMNKEQREFCIQGGSIWCDPSPAYESFYGEGGHPSYPINGDTIVEYLWVDQYGAQRHSRKWPYGQWRDVLWHYGTDKIKVKDDKIGLFLEDNIKIPLGKYGEIYATPGVRLDYNSFMRKTDIAPRFSIDYSFPWNEISPKYATHLTGGLNRYYGRNMYAYGLDDGVYKLRTDIRRDSPDKNFLEILSQNRECANKTDTNCIVKYQSETRFMELNTPYVDEWMIGYSQNFANLNLTAKFIHRDGKDEVVKTISNRIGLPSLDGYDTTYYVYTNEGKSKTNIVSLKLENIEPFKIGALENKFSLAYDWTDVKRNKADYESTLSVAEIADEYVLWNGKPVRYSQRPASNYLKPYSIKLSTYHDWNMLGGMWNLSNLFSFKQGHKVNARKQVQNAQGKWTYATVAGSEYGLSQPSLDVYEAVMLPSTFTWDMRFGAEYKVYGKNTLFFNIDIYNVLDKSNVALASLSNRNDDLTPTYEVGRQFWLEVGYRY